MGELEGDELYYLALSASEPNQNIITRTSFLHAAELYTEEVKMDPYRVVQQFMRQLYCGRDKKGDSYFISVEDFYKKVSFRI